MAQPTYRGATGIAHEMDLIARVGEGDRKAFGSISSSTRATSASSARAPARR